MALFVKLFLKVVEVYEFLRNIFLVESGVFVCLHGSAKIQILYVALHLSSPHSVDSAVYAQFYCYDVGSWCAHCSVVL